ncbi:site-specific DNA-methyltransferase (adenine-specific) [Kushneria sinocarnis]|uniref:Methyltransferase n=1 Tax=Kushneria sinocarnis TaxID=595502 RepID=A0A420WUM5_9GAMM|nr:DNA methyltransferase [Kushneria sinocarnis]RKQ97122.1 site-specific DNA-methyltransferase (adenine-specific) [Kushneria sinocarnis]
MIQLLNMDCMDYMRSQPDDSFDLAIVDPPYFEGPNKPGFYRNGEFSSTLVPAGKYGALKHWEVPANEYFAELKRVSRHRIIWGANHFCDRFDASGPGWIVWDKENGASSFADAELASSTFDKAVRVFRYRWNGMIQGSHGNKRLNEKRIHPTQKPVKLYEWMLANYSKPGQRILDTHLGSASSAIAAHYFGCDFVGTELDADYFATAKARFNRETSQIDMFAGGAA